MAIAHISTSELNTVTTSTSYTWSHTIASGSDRILVVGVALLDTGSDTVTGVTFDSVDMTRAVAETGTHAASVYLYYLVEPNVTTGDVVVSLSSSVKGHGGAMNYTGVSQSSPIGATATAAPSSTLNADLTMTTENDNSFVVDCVTVVSTSQNITRDTDTLRWRKSDTGGTPAGGDESVASAGSYTASWTAPTSSDDWSMSGVEIVDVDEAGSAEAPTIFFAANF